MNTHLNWRQRLAKHLLTEREFDQSMEALIKEEQDLLQRDILNRELNMIDARHKLAGQKERLAFLGKWMTRTANEIQAVVDTSPIDGPNANFRP